MPSTATTDRTPGKVPAASREVIPKTRSVVVKWEPPTAWADGSTEGWDESEVQHYEVSLKRTASGGGVTWIDDSLNKPYIIKGTRAVFPLTKAEAESTTAGFPKFAARIKAIGWDNLGDTPDTETGDATPETIATSDGVVPSSSPTPSAFGHTKALHVQWSNINNNDPIVFELHMGTSSAFAPSSATLVTEVGAAAKSTERIAVSVTKQPSGSDLVVGTSYYFKTRSKDIDGVAASYSGASAAAVPLGDTPPTTGQVQSDGITPNAPGSPTLTAGYRSILLSWGIVTNTRDPLIYDVYDGTGSVLYGSTTAPAMLVDNLNPDTTYSFRVRARSAISGAASSLGSTSSAQPSKVPVGDLVTGTMAANVTLTGSLSSPNTSGTRVEINVGGYPLRYWNGATTWFSLDGSGNARFAGTITSDSLILGATFHTSDPTINGVTRITMGGGLDTLEWIRRVSGVDSMKAQFWWDDSQNQLQLWTNKFRIAFTGAGHFHVGGNAEIDGAMTVDNLAWFYGSVRLPSSGSTLQTAGGAWVGIGTFDSVQSTQNMLKMYGTGGGTPGGDNLTFTIWYDNTAGALKGRAGTGTVKTFASGAW